MGLGTATVRCMVFTLTIVLTYSIHGTQAFASSCYKRPETCGCLPGYMGQDCDEVIDNCKSEPCQNGGQCTNGVNKYTCTCPAGTTNTNCQTIIDNCASQPCKNVHQCTNGINSYSCTCLIGWTGTKCDKLINYCDDKPCVNGGTCVSTPHVGYTCLCPPGTTGRNCSTLVDRCNPNPCQNNATCILTKQNSVYCSCAPGYAGSNCTSVVNNCKSNPCKNGGKCLNAVNCFACVCHPGYTGDDCSTMIDNCASDPCRKNSTCVNGVNTFTCKCRDGFIGLDCCTPDPCYGDANPCLNGGTCSSTEDGYNCSCTDEWTGPQCNDLAAFNYTGCADDFLAIIADGVEVGHTRRINVSVSVTIPTGTRVLGIRAQNSFLGGGWKGIASDGRFASDERWRCTNETQLDSRWASDGFDDSSWPRVMYSKAPYTWMCPDYPVEAEWLWVDNYTYLGIVYCRLQILPSSPYVVKCAEHCLSCTVAGAERCDEGSCYPGYAYNPYTKSCDVACTPFCASCDVNGGGSCDPTGCTSGYYFNKHTLKCEPIFFTVCSNDNFYLYADGIYQASIVYPNTNKDTKLTFQVPPYTSVLAVKDNNTIVGPAGWRGFLTDLSVVSDKSWKCSTSVPDDESWRQRDFDDSDWTTPFTSDNVYKSSPLPAVCSTNFPNAAKFLWGENTFSKMATTYCRKYIDWV